LKRIIRVAKPKALKDGKVKSAAPKKDDGPGWEIKGTVVHLSGYTFSKGDRVLCTKFSKKEDMNKKWLIEKIHFDQEPPTADIRAGSRAKNTDIFNLVPLSESRSLNRRGGPPASKAQGQTSTKREQELRKKLLQQLSTRQDQDDSSEGSSNESAGEKTEAAEREPGEIPEPKRERTLTKGRRVTIKAKKGVPPRATNGKAKRRRSRSPTSDTRSRSPNPNPRTTSGGEGQAKRSRHQKTKKPKLINHALPSSADEENASPPVPTLIKKKREPIRTRSSKKESKADSWKISPFSDQTDNISITINRTTKDDGRKKKTDSPPPPNNKPSSNERRRVTRQQSGKNPAADSKKSRKPASAPARPRVSEKKAGNDRWRGGNKEADAPSRPKKRPSPARSDRSESPARERASSSAKRRPSKNKRTVGRNTRSSRRPPSPTADDDEDEMVAMAPARPVRRKRQPPQSKNADRGKRAAPPPKASSTSRDPTSSSTSPTKPTKDDKKSKPTKDDKKPTKPAKDDKKSKPAKGEKKPKPAKDEKKSKPAKDKKPTKPTTDDMKPKPTKEEKKPTKPTTGDKKPTKPTTGDKKAPTKTDSKPSKPLKPAFSDKPAASKKKPGAVREGPTDPSRKKPRSPAEARPLPSPPPPKRKPAPPKEPAPAAKAPKPKKKAPSPSPAKSDESDWAEEFAKDTVPSGGCDSNASSTPTGPSSKKKKKPSSKSSSRKKRKGGGAPAADSPPRRPASSKQKRRRKKRRREAAVSGTESSDGASGSSRSGSEPPRKKKRELGSSKDEKKTSAAGAAGKPPKHGLSRGWEARTKVSIPATDGTKKERSKSGLTMTMNGGDIAIQLASDRSDSDSEGGAKKKRRTVVKKMDKLAPSSTQRQAENRARAKEWLAKKRKLSTVTANGADGAASGTNSPAKRHKPNEDSDTGSRRGDPDLDRSGSQLLKGEDTGDAEDDFFDFSGAEDDGPGAGSASGAGSDAPAKKETPPPPDAEGDTEMAEEGQKETPKPPEEEEKGPSQPKALSSDAVSPEDWDVGVHGCKKLENHYKICNKLASGTYGTVYRAIDRKSKQLVALKKIKMDQSRDGFPITSLRELSLLQECAHVNVVEAREIVVSKKTIRDVYMVMDFCDHDLSAIQKIKPQPFIPSELKCVMQQLLRGVEHMHENWMIHRDLKPSNLLLTSKGIVKICDFGMARRYGSPIEAYTPNCCTLWYSSPEMLLKANTYDQKIDMWAVGCILAELVLGRALFRAGNDFEQIKNFCKVLGTPTEASYPGWNNLEMVKKWEFKMEPRTLLKLFHGAGPSLTRSCNLTSQGFALLESLLHWDPQQRLNASEALDHQWFMESPKAVKHQFLPTFPKLNKEHRSQAIKHYKHKRKQEQEELRRQGGFHF